jgi:ribonuclease P protein component
VLPASHRLRSSAEFGVTVRRGRRAGTRTVVVHVARPVDAGASAVPVRVGFVVGKPVGGAVVRNRTKRRLRALMRPLLASVVPGTRVVVRANPAAAGAPTPVLERDLASALGRAATAAGVLATTS